MLVLFSKAQDWVKWQDYSFLFLLYATEVYIQEALYLNQEHWIHRQVIAGQRHKESTILVLSITYNAVCEYQTLYPHPKDPALLLFFGKKER